MELAPNQATTTLSFDGSRIGLFGDGKTHSKFEGEVTVFLDNLE